MYKVLIELLRGVVVEHSLVAALRLAPELAADYAARGRLTCEAEPDKGTFLCSALCLS